MKVDNFVLLIILIITLIVISLLTECNRGRLTELEDNAIKDIVETFFHTNSAANTESGQWGYKITQITEGQYGGRRKQEILDNIGGHNQNDYITESEKNTYGDLIDSNITNTISDIINNQDRFLKIQFVNAWLIKDNTTGTLVQHPFTRYQTSSSGDVYGEWGYQISDIIESKYKDYSLSDLFANISLSNNSPLGVPVLSSYEFPDYNYVNSGLKQANITHHEYLIIKERLEEKYTDEIIRATIFIPPPQREEAICVGGSWQNSPDCISTCGAAAVNTQTRQLTPYFDVDGNVCDSEQSTQDIACNSYSTPSYVCANPHTINVIHVLVENRNKLQLVSFVPNLANPNPSLTQYDDTNYSFAAMKTLFGDSNFVSSVDGSEVIQQAIYTPSGYITSINKAYKLHWNNGPVTEECEMAWGGWSSWTPSCNGTQNYTLDQSRTRWQYQTRNSNYPPGTCNIVSDTQDQTIMCSTSQTTATMIAQNQQHVEEQMIGGM